MVKRGDMKKGQSERSAHDAASRFGGLQSIIEMFVYCVKRALLEFGADELAQLERANPNVATLAWLDAQVRQDTSKLLDTLAQRGKGRWHINATQRAELAASVGGSPALASPRVLFLSLALLIDRNFPTKGRSPEDVAWHLAKGAIRPPEAFLAGASNLPPRIGQMTPFAVARRWFSNLWLAPRIWNVSTRSGGCREAGPSPSNRASSGASERPARETEGFDSH